MEGFDIMQILHPVFIAIATVVAGLIGTYGAKLINKASEWFKTKVGSETYDNALKVAHGIYIYLEDKYQVSGMGETKKKEMEALLLEKFPNLTQAELDSINKTIWLEFNVQWYDLHSKPLVAEASKRLDG